MQNRKSALERMIGGGVVKRWHSDHSLTAADLVSAARRATERNVREGLGRGTAKSRIHQLFEALRWSLLVLGRCCCCQLRDDEDGDMAICARESRPTEIRLRWAQPLRCGMGLRCLHAVDLRERPFEGAVGMAETS